MPKTTVARASSDSSRLDPSTWTKAGLELLATGGVDAVRIEPLARLLGVTKGSFYWHFKDRADLLAAMLEAWRRQATLGVIERIERIALSPEDRLRQLIDLPLMGKRSSEGASIELAIRLWARSDRRAAAALAEIDEQRVRHIHGLLGGVGVEGEDERSGRAFLVYAYLLAEAFIPTALTPGAKSVCEDILKGVRSH